MLLEVSNVNIPRWDLLSWILYSPPLPMALHAAAKPRKHMSLWLSSLLFPLSLQLCCCSLTQSCPTLCNPMDCSKSGFPVHHQLLDQTQTHVRCIGDAIQPSHPVVPFFSCLQSFPASGSFPRSQFFTSGGQSIGALASASVLSVNIQDWFPIGLTALIFLQSKGLSRVFSNTTAQKHQFFGAQLSL